jgi:hypothetical protein
MPGPHAELSLLCPEAYEINEGFMRETGETTVRIGSVLAVGRAGNAVGADSAQFLLKVEPRFVVAGFAASLRSG